MVRKIDNKKYLLGTRDRRLAFATEIPKLYTLSPDKKIQVKEVSSTGIKTSHGPLFIKSGFFSTKFSPGGKRLAGEQLF